jgi:putative lipoic acid-binding regulatory protein
MNRSRSVISSRRRYGLRGAPVNTQGTCIVYPCSFPLKVMGRNSGAFEPAVRAIVQKHVTAGSVEYANQLSSGGTYLSITATFTATSREQLDALYRELNGHELVLMTL